MRGPASLVEATANFTLVLSEWLCYFLLHSKGSLSGKEWRYLKCSKTHDHAPKSHFEYV